MAEFLKVSGHDALYRDVSSKAIVNTNQSAHEEYLKKRNSVLQEKERISRQEQEINNIKSDISEIKQMLLTLIKDR